MSSELLRSTDPSAPWWRVAVPAWLVSIIIHLVFLITLGLIGAGSTVGLGPAQGTALDVTFELTDADDAARTEEEYFDEAGEESVTIETAESSATAALQPSFLDDEPAVDPTDALPELRENAGLSELGLAATPVGQNGGSSSSGRGKIDDGRARTGVFGAEAEGFKFVYVFDRSGSMGGSGRSALNSAKAELLASLEDLGDTHQFQIIFYNQQPTIFPLAGQEGRLVFANDPNKLRAEQFIRQITADGATSHEDALKAALTLRPDVIFFLTDADEPSLNTAQMKRVERLNSGRTVIHVIEFGMGPYLGVENFLVRLARENRGTHAYVDISKLGPVR